MDIKVTGRKMQVSQSLYDYATEKVENSMKVFDIDPMTAEVVLHVEKNKSNPNSCIAEITLRTKGSVIRAEEASEDMYAAIDLATDKVSRQLRKYKTRILDRRKDRVNAAVVAAAAAALEVEAPSEDDAIVRTKEVELMPLSEEEALLQIDLLGHDFFMFIDQESGQVNVLYRRKMGGYGLLKPVVGTKAE